MNLQLLRASVRMLVVATLSVTSTSGHAEAHCPGGVPGLHPRLVAGALLVIPVVVNHSASYDFMVDTGSQLNVIDPALAAQLNLKPQATVGLVETAARSQASLGVVSSLQAGSQEVEKPLVAIQDLGPIQAADPRIRGVLGENFLAHFDVLIDNSRGRIEGQSAVEAVGVRQRDSGRGSSGGGVHQFLGRGDGVQERIVAVAVEMDEH